ncbi:OmpA family protein [Cytophaga hutchinsonii]|uniref:Outer membrane protein A n=1 Tax=Cytophaga hutchinsonii (strain ATCC 33406 / DSM 1761 / CIP 103989 / NBRC 15051 / NCIMB 9469 / D465) TaxID=269798 RepID=A0A6N4SNM5_CYTH3|nr:OmpA family protein [Cytophaga hutchinsonii]ABG57882.1 outer membrane protein A [Cytophaga hutchinsonii ATCC 33406]SFX08075.1 Outer membrane protein OmpA [Cytophaga hutchinsonii ATCC 33406]
MRVHIFILIALYFSLNTETYAQSKRDKDLMIADYMYTHLAFATAIDHYEKVVEHNNDAAIMVKLADCYRMIDEFEKAVACYSIAIKSNSFPNAAYPHYAETLMTLGRYEEAKQLLITYQNNNPANRSITNEIRSCDYADSLLKLPPTGAIYFESFNTDGFEFGPALRKNDLVFTTDSVYSTESSKKDKWTGHSFYQIRYTELNAEGRASEAVKNLGTKVNSKYHDGPCTFCHDGDTMFFTRTNMGISMINNGPKSDPNKLVHLQIMVASKQDPDTKEYKKIKPFVHNKSTYSTIHPTLSYGGQMLVFASDMPGGEGGIDLYMTTLDARGKWTKPVNLGKGINTEGDEVFPSFDGDSILYFSSNGWVGLGGLDIYKSKWDKQKGVFVVLNNMGIPVNSSYDDMSFVESRNGSIAHFASNRPAPKDNDNIYSYVAQSIFLKLIIIDGATKKPLENCYIELISKPDARTLSSDKNGNTVTPLYLQTDYNARINKAGYRPVEIPFSTLDVIGNDTIKKIINMQSDFQISYTTIILDEKTKFPITDPSIVWIEKEGKKKDTIRLATGEQLNVELKPNSMYYMYGLKTNYYSKQRFVSTKGIESGSGTTRIVDTLYMKKLEVGEIYKIDDIYYDYNKATIRQDAKPALDQLMNLLTENPTMKIQLNSHTDCRGSDVYNMKLSQNRARAVVTYLVERGISADRLKFKGYGETLPVTNCACTECTEQQYQDNRRTEFQIIEL